MSTLIRRVSEADIAVVVRLVHELAEYEKAPQECHLTEPALREALFNEAPALFGHVAEVDGEVAGFALWFKNFSTWRGVHGIYLEDLYVSTQQRGSGLGKALLAALAAECVERGYARLEWSVLNWNPAVGFYKALGALPQDEWTTYRLTDEPLRALAKESHPI
ncbi:GCN5 family acetyltransferase [Prauserella marina]|uniref:L-amino acid N-acyltransferase YncA n=1 Tax=Prauserella marina TaxID=530584 RepID=A0A222VVN6_9PSEU|nr:GNAT family N-acetyltransferase [Prauserella marina]ASR37892.1 GCN5 family acetyltransferase [Prauserella marina]PWV73096.1 L-amino acid N-acyltransferase YncA [Prauserella marina]SDD71937.1 L-amino acid N-acyltransferase YncA [Prauserella marina]